MSRWKSGLAALPLGVYARDNLYQLVTVQSKSMEPTLREGDVVLVRKADLAGCLESISSMFVGTNKIDRDGDLDVESNRHEERARLYRFELLHGVHSYVPLPRLLESPPTVLSGDVVVYRDPEDDCRKHFCIKQVVGSGGQWIRSSSPGRRRLEALPPYSVYVEGENLENSRDSRQFGPMSKNLVVGVAEYVIWPPTRWGAIPRLPCRCSDGTLRAVWP